jgi:predicted phosphate transport protein (TIGR00153 family)
MEATTRSEETDLMVELQRECANVLEGALAFREMLREYRDPAALRKKLKDIEHHGDDIVHGIYEALNTSFITPLEREDISALASGMDSILDMTYAAALRLDLYGIRQPTKPMLELVDTICSSVKVLQNALRLINDPAQGDVVEARAVEINRLENVADDIMNVAVADLFKTNDPIQIMKLKEIYEKLEESTDYCEDVANILSDIVAKNR